jgi:predicted RNase H-like nuclease
VYVGVDGCPGGWVAVAVGDAGFLDAARFDDFGSLLAAFDDAKVIGVDIPIGLVDAPLREADRAARAFLSGQASSVFNAPVRSALAAGSYDEAKRVCAAVSGKGLSRQSFALLGKIRQVDAHAGDARLHEVHPEVSFRLMHGGRIAHGKKTWGGLQTRLALLRAESIELPAALGSADAVGVDDVVDAAAAAWSARRIAAGTATRLPESGAQCDPSGRPIAIWG